MESRHGIPRYSRYTIDRDRFAADPGESLRQGRTCAGAIWSLGMRNLSRSSLDGITPQAMSLAGLVGGVLTIFTMSITRLADIRFLWSTRGNVQPAPRRDAHGDPTSRNRIQRTLCKRGHRKIKTFTRRRERRSRALGAAKETGRTHDPAAAGNAEDGLGTGS
jgi:hypothetical protein